MSVTGQMNPQGKIVEHRIELTPELKEYLEHLRANVDVSIEELRKANRHRFRKEQIKWDKLNCTEVKQCIDLDGQVLDLVTIEGAAEPANVMKAFICCELTEIGYGYHNLLMVELEWGE